VSAFSKSLLLAAAVLLPHGLSAQTPPELMGLRLNVNPDQIANNDTLAWSLIGVLGITLSMVSACGWGIYRHFHRQTPESKLLQELHDQQQRSGPAEQDTPAPPLPGQPWEKPGDWWKNPPLD